MKNAKPYSPGMTLMPGESTVVEMTVPVDADEFSEGFSGTFSLQEVPPPSEAPVQDDAERLGLVRGLRVSPSRGDMWRCAECNQMQKPDAPMVWVPDGVRKNDPEWSVTERCRQNAFNGHSSGWCVNCAPKQAVAKTLLPHPADYMPAFIVAAAIVAALIIGILATP